MVAALGPNCLNLYERPSLESIFRLRFDKIGEYIDLKFSSDQLYLKSEKGWAMVNLK